LKRRVLTVLLFDRLDDFAVSKEKAVANDDAKRRRGLAMVDRKRKK
jgi:hypothetical protein